MKRSKSLQQLSREHHLALVMAQRARGVGARGDPAERLLIEAIERFNVDLERHFRVEEEVLLPAMKRAGESELVTRTLSEHAHLRRLAGELAPHDATTMQRFGDMLRAHVRFEERELFPVAETILSPEELDAIQREAEGAFAAEKRES